MRAIVVFSAGFLFVQQAISASPLQIRCWQLQDYDMNHIKQLIDLASLYNINRIQLSHNIVMDAEEPLSKPQLAADINAICKWAHAKGIKVDMWTHELNGIPNELLKDGRVDIDNPELWNFVREKYARLFRLCPNLDGLVLTMHETAQSVYDDARVSSSVPPHIRVAQLIDSLASVCASLGKDIFVRTFSYEPAQLQWIIEGIKACKSDVTVMSKCVPHDWQPYYPHNPAIGNVGGKKQVIEFDLGNEFTGLSRIPYINIDYVAERLHYGLSKGIVGAVFRVERLAWRSLGTPNWGVVDVCTRLLSNPSADSQALYKQWLARRYGKGAVEPLHSAFMRTPEIVNKTYFILGFWFTSHSQIPSYSYAKSSLRNRTTAKWDPTYKPIEQELLNPNRQTIEKIIKEKDIALNLAEASLSDVVHARPYLKSEDFESLFDAFERLRAAVVVWRAVTEVVFSIDVYNATKSDRNREFLAQAADRLEQLATENKEHLIEMASDYANPRRTTNVDNAMELVQLARRILNQGSE
ncbi:MAG: hypothetical protein QHI38_12645 [Armatimonadota bacterium]|nr:hypothetical protein [Armatimonadota bacterium]